MNVSRFVNLVPVSAVGAEDGGGGGANGSAASSNASSTAAILDHEGNLQIEMSCLRSFFLSFFLDCWVINELNRVFCK